FEVLKSAPKEVTTKTVINNYLKAIGGRQKLENFQDLKIKMNETVMGNLVTITEKIKSSDKYIREMASHGRIFIKIIINGDDVSEIRHGKKQNLSKEDKELLKTSLFERYYLELNYDADNYKTELLGKGTFNGKEVYVLQITTP